MTGRGALAFNLLPLLGMYLRREFC